MDKRDFEVIENKKIIEKDKVTKSVVTNPIAKKFVEYKEEKKNFKVSDLFKK